MNKRDYESLIHWISENKKMMEFTGAFNISVVVPQALLSELYNVTGNGIAHSANMGQHGMYSGRTVQLMGMDVRTHPTLGGNPDNKEEAIILQAEGMNFARPDVQPITKESTGWPIRKNAKLFRDVMKKVQDWCEAKKSPWFQRRDVMRIGGLGKYMASECIKYYAEVDDIFRRGKWWCWDSYIISPQPTPQQQRAQYLQQGQQLMSQGLVSKQYVMASMGIDLSAEAKKMERERQMMKMKMDDPTGYAIVKAIENKE